MISLYPDVISTPAPANAELAVLPTGLAHPLDPGAIVYNSWGFGQTNIDFYLVVHRTTRFVRLHPIKAKLVEGGGSSMCGQSMPVKPDIDISKISKADLKNFEMHKFYEPDPSRRHPFLIKFKYGGGFIWEGKSHYTSWYY